MGQLSRKGEDNKGWAWGAGTATEAPQLLPGSTGRQSLRSAWRRWLREESQQGSEEDRTE